MCVYIHVCMYMCVYIHTHTHVGTMFGVENMTVNGTDAVFSITALRQVHKGNVALNISQTAVISCQNTYGTSTQ